MIRPQPSALMNLRSTLLALASVTLAVVILLFVLPPFNGSELVLRLDPAAVIAGVLAMIVVPAVVMRSVGAAAAVAVAVPAYLYAVLLAVVYVSFSR